MSQMLPKETIEAIKTAHNVILGAVGIPVTLYKANNSTSLEAVDAFGTQDDRTYTTVQTTCFIDWSPSTYKLRKLNVYTEGSLPILCHLPNNLGEIEINSYISVPIWFVPKTINVSEFDLVNEALPHMHNAVIFSTFSLAPRRKVT